MIALFLVLAASLLVAGLFLGGFIWSVKSDQFEDKQGAAMRMLYDDAALANPLPAPISANIIPEPTDTP